MILDFLLVLSVMLLLSTIGKTEAETLHISGFVRRNDSHTRQLKKKANIFRSGSESVSDESVSDVTYCDRQGKKVSVCHYDEETKEYKTLCVSKNARGHLEKHQNDHQGSCELASVAILDTLSQLESADEVLEAIRYEDLALLVQNLKATLPKELGRVITPGALLEVWFPHESLYSSEFTGELDTEGPAVRYLTKSNQTQMVTLVEEASPADHMSRRLLPRCFDEIAKVVGSILGFLISIALARGVGKATERAGEKVATTAVTKNPAIAEAFDDFVANWDSGDTMKVIIKAF